MFLEIINLEFFKVVTFTIKLGEYFIICFIKGSRESIKNIIKSVTKNSTIEQHIAENSLGGLESVINVIMQKND